MISFSLRAFESTLFSFKTKIKQTLKRESVLFGGQGWIRTTEVVDGRFTVCSLWPLGNLPIFNLQKNGAGGRTRTPDLLITNQLLYQLSYTSVSTLEYNITSNRVRQVFFLTFLIFLTFFLFKR